MAERKAPVRFKKKAKTDTRLLETALEQFGGKGFEGASTRAIAAAAGTAMSSITYHYGGKEGLYLATADYVSEQVNERLTATLGEEVLEDLGHVAQLDKRAARDQLELLLSTYLTFFLSPDSAPLSRFIIREQMQPTEAFEILYEQSFRIVSDYAAALIIRLTEGRIGEQDARIHVMTLLGQALVFRAARQSSLRVIGWEDFAEEDAARVAAIVGTHCRTLLIWLEQAG